MNKPHVIRNYDIVKVGDLKIGQVFYPDFDNFVFFFSTNKRYVQEFEEDGAIVQCLHKESDGTWGWNLKAKYHLDAKVYILTGEHVKEWEDMKNESICKNK